MKCTDKERQTCNVEKMGCEGCYYNEDNDRDIEILEKELKFYKECYEMQKQEISERNIKARQLLAKLKGIKTVDIVNLHEINILDEIEKELDLKSKEIIPISLVEEKIEELNKKEKQELKGLKGQDRYFVKQIYQYKRSVLQELLEKRK